MISNWEVTLQSEASHSFQFYSSLVRKKNLKIESFFDIINITKLKGRDNSKSVMAPTLFIGGLFVISSTSAQLEENS